MLHRTLLSSACTTVANVLGYPPDDAAKAASSVIKAGKPAFFIFKGLNRSLTVNEVRHRRVASIYVLNYTWPMKKTSFLLIVTACLCAPLWAQADIYKSIDADGNITYSNVPNKGAIKLDIEGFTSNNPKAERNTRTKTPTPANFPRVDNKTQNLRDDKRKQILISELETEQKALQDAKKTYAENAPPFSRDTNGKTDEKIQRLQADVDAHEKNVQLLQKELASLK